MTIFVRDASGSVEQVSWEPLSFIDKSSFEIEAAELPKEHRVSGFHPFEHPHDRALSKLQQAGYLTEEGDATELLSNKDLFPFDFAITKQIRDLLNKQRTVKLLGEEVFLDYTLRKLFEYVYFHSQNLIDEIEVIGSSTFWVLRRGYFEQLLKNLGFENPEELFSEEFLESIEHDPNDHDFRCGINSSNLTYQQTYDKLDYLGSLLITFLTLKINPEAAQFSDHENFNKIKNRAFYKLNHSKEPHYYIASPRIGAKSEVKAEIMFVDRDRVYRKHLFIQDAVRINLNHNLGFCPMNGESVKKEIKPISDLPAKHLPFLHRLLMIIDAVDIGSIDHMGFPLYVSYLMKGRISLKKSVEEELAKGFAQLLIKYPEGAAGWWQEVVDKVFDSHHKPKEEEDLKGKSEFIEKYKLTGKRQSLPLFMLKALEILQKHLNKKQLSQTRNLLASMALVKESDNIYESLMACIKNERIEIDLLLAFLQLFALNLYMQPQIPEGSAASKIFLRKHCGAPALQIYFPGDAETKTMLLPFGISDALALIKDKMGSLGGKALEDLSKLYLAFMPARGASSSKNPVESYIKDLEWDVDELIKQAVSLVHDADSQVKSWLLDFIICLQPMACVSDCLDPLIEAFPRLAAEMQSFERREQFLNAAASVILPKNPSQSCMNINERLLEALKDFDCQDKGFIELWALFLAHAVHSKWHQKAVFLFSEYRIAAKEALAEVLALQSPGLAQTVMEEYLGSLIEGRRFAALQEQLDKKQKALVSAPLIVKSKVLLLTEELSSRRTINAKQLASFKDLMQGDLSGLSREAICLLAETVASCLITPVAADADMVWKLAQLNAILKDPGIVKWMDEPMSLALKALKYASGSSLPKMSSLVLPFIEISIEYFLSEEAMQKHPEMVLDFLAHSLDRLKSAAVSRKLPPKIETVFSERQASLFHFLKEHDQHGHFTAVLKLCDNFAMLKFSSEIFDEVLWLVSKEKSLREECLYYSGIFTRFFDAKDIDFFSYRALLLPIIEMFIEESICREVFQRAEYWLSHYAAMCREDLSIASDRWGEWLDALLEKNTSPKKKKGIASKETLESLLKAMQNFNDPSASRWSRLFGLIADSAFIELKREVWKLMSAPFDEPQNFQSKPHFETDAYVNALKCLGDTDSALCYKILSEHCIMKLKHLDQLIPIERCDELFYILALGALKGRESGELGVALGVLKIRGEIVTLPHGNKEFIDKFDVKFIEMFADCRHPYTFNQVCALLINLTHKADRTVDVQKLAILYMKLIKEFPHYSQKQCHLFTEIDAMMEVLTTHYLYNFPNFLNVEQLIIALTNSLGAIIPKTLNAAFLAITGEKNDCRDRVREPNALKALFAYYDRLIELNHHEEAARTLSIEVRLIPGMRTAFAPLWPKLLKSYIGHFEASSNIKKEALAEFFMTVYFSTYATPAEKPCLDLFLDSSIRYADKMNMLDILGKISETAFITSVFAPVMADNMSMFTNSWSEIGKDQVAELTAYFAMEASLHSDYLLHFLRRLFDYETDNAIFYSELIKVGHTVINSLLKRFPRITEKVENIQLFTKYFYLSLPLIDENMFNKYKALCELLLQNSDLQRSFVRYSIQIPEINAYINPARLLWHKEEKLYKTTIKNIFIKLLKIKTRASILQAIEILKVHGSHLYAIDPAYVCNLVQQIAALCAKNPFFDLQGIYVFDRLMQGFIPEKYCFASKSPKSCSMINGAFSAILSAFASVKPANLEEHERLIMSWCNTLIAAYKNLALKGDTPWLTEHFNALSSFMIAYTEESKNYKIVKVNLGLLLLTIKDACGNEESNLRKIRVNVIDLVQSITSQLLKLDTEESQECVDYFIKLVDRMLSA